MAVKERMTEAAFNALQQQCAANNKPVGATFQQKHALADDYRLTDATDEEAMEIIKADYVQPPQSHQEGIVHECT